jgi:hypothetical protein
MLLRIIVASILLALILPELARAHGAAEWIERGGIKNAAGELCCGERDCKETPAQHVTLPAPGYRLPSGMFVPESEAQPSPDGQFWICVWGGQRKCFFAPVPTF